MLKLKPQNFVHLMWRSDSFEKTLILGKIESRRRRGWQRLRWLDGISDSWDKLWEMVKDTESWSAAVHGVTKSRTRLSDWTTMKVRNNHLFVFGMRQKQKYSRPENCASKKCSKVSNITFTKVEFQRLFCGIPSSCGPGFLVKTQKRVLRLTHCKKVPWR